MASSKRSSKGGKKGGGFRYKKRGSDSVRKRANQKGGSYDSCFKSEFEMFKPAEGDNHLRVLPPTWEDAEHFGLDIFVHYGIGSDDAAYLSLRKMKNIACPLDEELVRAQREGNEELTKDLRCTKRCLVWVIDRNNEDKGPLLWSMPWTVDKEFSSKCRNKRTGATYNIDDPEEGYDVYFTRTGTKRNTKYEGFDIDRDPSPLHENPKRARKWLKFITDNPLTSTLNYYDYKHIATVLQGGLATTDDEEDGDDNAPTTRSKRKEKQRMKKKSTKKKSSKKKRKVEEEEEDEDDVEDDDDWDLDDDETTEDEDGDDDDAEDEDEDEDGDEEEDDAEEEDDEEEEEEDDEEEDDDDAEEDGDDDEDDDEYEDEDDDEDEEEEEPAPKPKKKKGKKSKGKAKDKGASKSKGKKGKKGSKGKKSKRSRM